VSRKLALALASIALLAAALPAYAAAKTSYYVSLGDSLSVGYQPRASGSSFTTRQGYVDDLFKIERRKLRGLRMVKFGCAGETTGSISTDSASCSYGLFANQLAAATAFFKAHRGQIAFVTIDIGANNVDGCAPHNQIDATCLNNGIAAIKKDTPIIAKRLRRAAGAHTQIVDMNLYDPYLELYIAGSQDLAKASVGLADQVNKTIVDGFAKSKIKTADIANAFQIHDLTTMTNLPGVGQVPVAVARNCQLTWMCAAPPVGPNIHANPAGYLLIAQTFAKLIKP
jgi:lysophospholipase L1-like esterase